MMQLINIKSKLIELSDKLASSYSTFLLRLKNSSFVELIGRVISHRSTLPTILTMLSLLSGFLMARTVLVIALSTMPVQLENSLIAKEQNGAISPWKTISDRLRQNIASKKEYIYTKLNIQLIGITYSSIGPSVAIINTSRSVNQLIADGEMIFGGIKVVAIETGRVRFREADREFVVDMPPSTDLSKALAGIKDTSSSVSAVSPKRLASHSLSSDPEIKKITSKLEKQPLDIFKYVNIRQIIEDKKLKGIEINIRRKKKLIEKLGFRNKDIITHIDGVPFGEYVKKHPNASAILAKKDVKLTVLRDGRSVSFSLVR